MLREAVWGKSALLHELYDFLHWCDLKGIYSAAALAGIRVKGVTRKITDGVAKISLGRADYITLGNLDAKRDWGYAPEFVEGMWRILQAKTPDDYVLATGETRTVREFVENSFKVLGEEISWKNEGINEIGILKRTGKIVVDINPRYFRPTEVDLLIGSYEKAKNDLGWEPKTKFEDLVKIMVKSDFEKIKARNGL